MTAGVTSGAMNATGRGAGPRKQARRAFVSLGANLGERAAALRAARAALAALPGTTVVAASRIFETAPRT